MTAPLVRIAATADLHIRTHDDLTQLRSAFRDLHLDADVLVIAGDLTELGLVAEMELLADILKEVAIPVFVTFGNHDRRGMRRSALKKVLRAAGVVVLEGTGARITVSNGATIAIAGVTGTGGGFNLHGEEFGRGVRFARAVMVKSRRESARLRKTLRELHAASPDALIVISHFAPTISTLGTEPVRKHWMLGNALLGSTIDEFDADLVIHGHAHLGNENGTTDGGTPVLNVALPIIGGIRLLEIDAEGRTRAVGLRQIQSRLLESRVRESDVR